MIGDVHPRSGPRIPYLDFFHHGSGYSGKKRGLRSGYATLLKLLFKFFKDLDLKLSAFYKLDPGWKKPDSEPV
jgi:hypothetical protein